VNLLIFILYSVGITYFSTKIPASAFTRNQWLFKVRKWERDGQIYQRLLNVKRWKGSLPELSDFIKSVFPKKQIKEYSQKYFQAYFAESCRSELTHWCIILSTFLFLFWCDFKTYALIALIAVILNLPYVIIQRYNRPRIMKIIVSEKRQAFLTVQ
jgi:glycosyl-4,4'-diaponeurosporenoate acyltransferase